MKTSVNQSLTQRLANRCTGHLEGLISVEFFANAIPTFIYLGAAIYGESLQEDALKKAIESDWLTGHLSDFAFTAGVSCFGLALSCRNKYLQAASVVIPPSVFTYLEIFAANYDKQDIAIFWVSAAVAYLTSKSITAKRLGDLYGRIISIVSR